MVMKITLGVLSIMALGATVYSYVIYGNAIPGLEGVTGVLITSVIALAKGGR